MQVLNKISTAAIIVGLVLLFGAVGESDCGTSTSERIILQVGISVALMFAGLMTKAIINNK